MSEQIGGGNGRSGARRRGSYTPWVTVAIVSAIMVCGITVALLFNKGGLGISAAIQPAPAGDALTTATLALPIAADPTNVNLTPLATFALALGGLDVRIEIAEEELGVLYKQRERLLIEMLKVD